MNKKETAEYVDKTKTYIRNEFNQYSYFVFRADLGDKEFAKRKQFLDDVLDYIEETATEGPEIKQQIKEIYIEGKSFKYVSEKYDVLIPTIQKRINSAIISYVRESLI